MQKSKNAFTLVELMIVVVLLGIIAAFGIPDFSKSHERVDEKEGEHSLRVIATAMEMYRVRNNGYPDPTTAGFDLDVVDINTTLFLGVIEQSMTYECTDDDDDTTFLCTAVSTYGWELDVAEADEGIPRCSSGTCPTCTGAGC